MVHIEELSSLETQKGFTGYKQIQAALQQMSLGAEFHESQLSPTWWFNRRETAQKMEILENNKGSFLNTVNCYWKDYSSFLSIWS